MRIADNFNVNELISLFLFQSEARFFQTRARQNGPMLNKSFCALFAGRYKPVQSDHPHHHGEILLQRVAKSQQRMRMH